jgi:hypothetical protein
MVEVGKHETVPVMQWKKCTARWKQFPIWNPEKRLENSMSPKGIQNEPCRKVDTKVRTDNERKYVIDMPSRIQIALIDFPEAGG